MEAKLDKLPNSKIELKIEITWQEFQNFIDRAVFSLGKEVEIKGFRKGSAPKEIIEKELGRDKILTKAADFAIKEAYIKTIKENKIEPIEQPEAEILKFAEGNPFIFKIKTSVLPQINLPDYKKIANNSNKKEIQVQDKEIDESLNWVKKSRAKFSLKEGQAQEKDFVEIEYWSENIKELDRSNIQKDAFILGEGHLIKGFQEQLVGMKQGQEKSFFLSIPQEHQNPELAGKKTNFTVKIISLQKVELPEFTDEFAKNLGDFKDLEDFKNKLKEGILSEKKEEEKIRLREEILDNIADKTSCEPPVFLIEQEKEHLLSHFKEKVKNMLKISFEGYAAKTKKTEKEILDSFSEQALKNIKKLLVLKEIGKKENIDVKEQELEEEINKTIKNHKDIESAQKIDLSKLKEYTKEAMATEKTFQILENLAN